MTVAQRCIGDFQCSGSILCQPDALTAQSRASVLLQEDLTRFPVALTDCRIFDSMHTLLGATPTSDDDLALVGGTFGSAPPMIQAGDVKTVTKTRRLRFIKPIPHNYVAGQTLNFILGTKMTTTVADGSCTVDVEAYRADKEGGIGSDLCSTSATSMNSTSFSEKSFTINPATLNPGDWLDVRVTIASVDTATGTAVIPTITNIDLACDTKG